MKKFRITASLRGGNAVHVILDVEDETAEHEQDLHDYLQDYVMEHILTWDYKVEPIPAT